MNYPIAMRVFVLLGLTAFSGSSPAPIDAANPKTANPNHQDPTVALAVHGDESSVQLQTECQARYELALKNVRVALEKESKSQLNKLEPRILGDANVALLQLHRGADQLLLLGEPAGAEFLRRHTALNRHVPRLAIAYASSPEGANFLAKARQFLARNQPERQAALKRTLEQINKKQWTEAEKTLFGVLDKLGSITVFLEANESRTYYEPLADAQLAVTINLRKIRSEEAAGRLAQRVKELTPDLDGLLAQVAQAASSIQSAGQANVDGQSVPGPQAMTHLLDRWRLLHAGVQRYHGVLLASQLASMATLYGGSAVMPAVPTATGAPSHENPLLTRYATKFNAEMVAALVKLIEADTVRAPAAEVPELYASYLSAAAPVVPRVSDVGFASSLQAALRKLAAKAPEFAANVQAYEGSTDELLRWRRRTAEAQARQLESLYPPVLKPFHQTLTSHKQYLGLFDATSPDYPWPHLMASTLEVLEPALPNLMGQHVAVVGGRGLPGGKNAISVLNEKTYASYRTAAEWLAPHLDALRSDLFVTDAAPPLSLAAATALETARTGDFELVGGELKGLHVEAVVTRLATMPDAAAPLLPLGVLVATKRPDGNGPPVLSQVTVRFELQPKWVLHRAFLAPLTNEGGAVAIPAAPGRDE